MAADETDDPDLLDLVERLNRALNGGTWRFETCLADDDLIDVLQERVYALLGEYEAAAALLEDRA